uniref:Uncharacterized protein n=1 Tax=Acrobeloides nanus TaxID=290746 RepID=A0A914DRR9_9BILA
MTEKKDLDVLKILQDPTSPKVVCAIFSLLQLLIYSNNTHGSPVFTVIVAILTFLASCFTIGLIVGKKTESFANFCLFKCVTQKKRIDWNGFYYTYATAFGSFNLLAVIASAYYYRDNWLAWNLGLLVTILYYADGYYALGKIDTIHVNESSTPGCYARFLKLIGSFPKITRLLVLTFNVVLIVLLACRIGCQHYYDYYHDCGNPQDLNMMINIAIMLAVVSISDVFIHRVNKIKVGIALTTMCFSMCGFFICLSNADRRIPMTIITFVTFLLTFFMAIAESYVKSNEPIMETNNRTILPSNLAKNIMNPVVPDAFKVQIIQEADPSELTNDSYPLLQ